MKNSLGAYKLIEMLTNLDKFSRQNLEGELLLLGQPLRIQTLAVA